MINILFIGDISGVMGKKAIKSEVNKLKKELNIDFVIANAENTTLGRGLNWVDYNFLCNNGVDFITMGNHTWHKNEIYEILEQKNNIIRPFNINPQFQQSKYGNGTFVVKIKNTTFRITNLLGSSIELNNLQSNPFIALEKIIFLDEYEKTDFHIVDFHSETTSEKNAFFIEYKSKVSAILGTHTHVQTNDYKIVNNTAYITDVGMTGASDGVIGAQPDEIIEKFKGIKNYFKLIEQNTKYQFCAVLLKFDETKKTVYEIKPIYIYE